MTAETMGRLLYAILGVILLHRAFRKVPNLTPEEKKNLRKVGEYEACKCGHPRKIYSYKKLEKCKHCGRE